jgi:hypothetical protein
MFTQTPEGKYVAIIKNKTNKMANIPLPIAYKWASLENDVVDYQEHMQHITKLSGKKPPNGLGILTDDINTMAMHGLIRHLMKYTSFDM